MTGYLRSNGINISEGTVGETLKIVSPAFSKERGMLAKRSFNPKPYIADYFGQKLHVDQNEKLVMYGATHVLARDGHSGMVVAFVTMPVKNNVIIYDSIFRYLANEYGLWDTIRVDGGREFNLLQYGQELFAGLRNDTSRVALRRGKSTDNHIIERIWGEVNKRVNYPIKEIINEMVHQQLINICSDDVKFSLSWVICKVATEGVKRFVNSWNNHTIPKKGIPIKISKKSRCAKVNIDNVPHGQQAALWYEQSKNGKIKRDGVFGSDPLKSSSNLEHARSQHFERYFPDISDLFESVISGDGSTFKNAILYHIQLTQSLKLHVK